jgi:hypothetical protein
LPRKNISIVFDDLGIETVNFIDSHELFKEGIDVVMLGEWKVCQLEHSHELKTINFSRDEREKENNKANGFKGNDGFGSWFLLGVLLLSVEHEGEVVAGLGFKGQALVGVNDTGRRMWLG